MAEDLEFALQRLADESRPVRMTNLAPLSDVPRGQAEMFRKAWLGFSPQRRLELMRELVEQSEDNIHLNFYMILRQVLHDPDPEVRRLAIEGLWEDDRSNLVPVLATLATEDPAPEVRAAAAASLGRFVLLGALGDIDAEPAERAEEALRTAWYRQGEATEVRRRALEGLAYVDEPDVRELIHMAYYDEDQLLRQSAVFAMGRSADRRWARYVLAELESREAAMRFEAAVAAGELGLTAAVQRLIRLLDDSDGTVREAAATSLGQIGGPAAKRALEAAAAGGDEILADAAGAALEELSFNAGVQSDPLFDLEAIRTRPLDGQRPAPARPGGMGGPGRYVAEEAAGGFDDDEDDVDQAEASVAGAAAGREDESEYEDEYDGDQVYEYDEEEVDWLSEEAGEEDEEDAD